MNKIKKLIESIVNEELSILGNDSLGNIVFSPQRKDNVDKTEPDTKIEKDIYNALFKHVNYNNPSKLKDKFDVIYDLASQDKYDKEFKPVPGHAYRFLYGLSLGEASGILGIPVEEIEANKGKVFQSIKSGVLNPFEDGGIQSWAIDFTISTFSDLVDYMDIGLNKPAVFIIFETSVPTGGKFILNSEFLKNVKGFEGFENENEIISKGPVVFNAAIILYTSVAAYDGIDKIVDDMTALL